MKLQNMFKKTSVRSHYISLKKTRPEVPEGLLRKCNKCGAAIIAEDVKNGYYICPKCHGYFRVHAYRRVEMLADEGSFEEWDKEMEFVNPLDFKGYEEKVNALKERTKLNEPVHTYRVGCGLHRRPDHDHETWRDRGRRYSTGADAGGGEDRLEMRRRGRRGGKARRQVYGQQYQTSGKRSGASYRL